MCIVDEAHRFRNAWVMKSDRMLSWMARIHQCVKVVFMSGTPIVHDADIEMDAFHKMMKGIMYRVTTKTMSKNFWNGVARGCRFFNGVPANAFLSK